MFISVHACGCYLCNDHSGDFIPFSTPDQFMALKEGKKIPQITEIVEREPQIIFEQKALARLYGVRYQFPNPAGEYLRSHAAELMEPHGIDLKERLYEISILLTRDSIRRSSEKKDKLIVESVRALDELDQVINILSERLREWYALHYPEMERKVQNNYAFAKKVSQGTSRRNSMGASLDPGDEQVIQEFASQILMLFDERKRLESYINEETQKIAPNLSSLVGPVLSARLMSVVGGLDELSRLPSSTIQVLGAEKALFRHLRTGAKPPKHGLIFQHPLVNRAPRKLRGKISRSLASKIAILSRVDCYSSDFVADEVEETLLKRVSRLQGESK
ncbi:MAG: C/D box methylation guide ribonucleoprotein complex aNOP56 subunit [Theionarchaea archaeon]|nr:C/D box methylation guide ribonucleoprotein complex aNOP56 subunit [Theionarchaea archaeon]